ncbi:flagellar assembly peptidoglycan hydrolase FlgJ [Undibacter mobilis]|uniref:Flagellar rod assembly protein FlgJ n=1 Tax=Undibacter mobilis TaxID=2292256 RepID=A0A371BC72_9BRAD|nr:flagellar assembly peptidoglycan hydrolase FlgJ [Undibacter mobilis]RDV05186.1 flagellar rod assembly protein FlgJ [Undibacter mobilis]
MSAGIGGISLPVPGQSATDLLKSQTGAVKGKSGYHFTPEQMKARAKKTSEDFEAVFLNNMFQQMFTGVQGEGPFGGAGATGVWRTFLTDEYAKNFAKAGGIGIAKQVYSTLLAQQEIRQ